MVYWHHYPISQPAFLFEVFKMSSKIKVEWQTEISCKQEKKPPIHRQSIDPSSRPPDLHQYTGIFTKCHFFPFLGASSSSSQSKSSYSSSSSSSLLSTSNSPRKKLRLSLMTAISSSMIWWHLSNSSGLSVTFQFMNTSKKEAIFLPWTVLVSPVDLLLAFLLSCVSQLPVFQVGTSPSMQKGLPLAQTNFLVRTVSLKQGLVLKRNLSEMEASLVPSTSWMSCRYSKAFSSFSVMKLDTPLFSRAAFQYRSITFPLAGGAFSPGLRQFWKASSSAGSGSFP